MRLALVALVVALVAAAACGTPPAATVTSSLDGTYVGTARAATGPGRTLTLTLSETGRATMRTDFGTGDPAIVEQGRWTPLDGDRATVNLTEVESTGDAPDRTIDVVIVFERRDNLLVAVEYDRALFGEAGLTLQRQ